MTPLLLLRNKQENRATHSQYLYLFQKTYKISCLWIAQETHKNTKNIYGSGTESKNGTQNDKDTEGTP
jgi:hypothetical protein